MCDIATKGERIERLTLISALQDQGQLESVEGIAGVLELEEGLPNLPDIGSYLRRVVEMAKRRQIIFLGQRAMDAAYQGTDSQEIAAHVADRLVPIQSGAEDNEDGRSPQSIVENFPGGGFSAFMDPSLRKRGLPTGLFRLDDMLGGGLQDGELIILAARTAMGKSALALNICHYVTMHPRNPQRADIFSLEMSGESLVTRMLCAAARVDSAKFRAGFLNRDERSTLQRALYEIVNAPLRIHDDFRKTLAALLKRIKHAHKHGSKLIVIDYAQLMVTGTRTENRNLEIGEIARALKMVAHDLQIPVLLLSQIGRSAEKRGGDMRPQLSDLKDSGSLEESADTVLAIYRAEVYKRDNPELHGLADIEVLKQRAGATGRISVRFVKQWTSFENPSDETPPDEPYTPPPDIQRSPMPESDSWD